MAEIANRPTTAHAAKVIQFLIDRMLRLHPERILRASGWTVRNGAKTVNRESCVTGIFRREINRIT